MKQLFFILLFFTVSSAFGKSSSLSLHFINQQKDSVPKNGRLELGLTLPDSAMKKIQLYLSSPPHQREGLNPFVSWDIDVVAHFWNDKKTIKFDAVGFWYKNIQRNYSANTWNRLPTEYPFRIRYAPPEKGKWKVAVVVAVKKQKIYFSDTLTFNVVSSTYGGIVSLDETTNYLKKDEKLMMPIGVNIPFPFNKNNLLWNNDKKARLHLSAWLEYTQLIKGYIEKGGESFRLLIDPSGTGIEFEECGNYSRRQNFAWEMDRVIALCEQKNITIQFNLMYQTLFMKVGGYNNYRFDFSDYWADKNAWPYEDKNYVSGYSLLLNSKTPSDMFLSPLGIKYLKERTRYIMARWGYSTALSIIELMSEPWHINQNKDHIPYNLFTQEGKVARKAVYNYHKVIASYIKDTLGYNQHLLGAVGGFPVGNKAIYSHFIEKNPTYPDSTWYLKNIDVIVISYYSDAPNKIIISKSNKNNTCGEGENSMTCTIKRLEKTYNKPVVFGETGPGDDIDLCVDNQQNKIDVLRFGLTGAVGHYVWAGFAYAVDEKGYVFRDERKIWPDIINASTYFNNVWMTDFLKQAATFGREKSTYLGENEIVESVYIINDTKTKATGYIYNRTFNKSTMAGVPYSEIKNTPCSMSNSTWRKPIIVPWRPTRLKIKGLKPLKKYIISYYGYEKSRLIYQREIRTSLFGNVILKHPLLIPDKEKTPLLLYRIDTL